MHKFKRINHNNDMYYINKGLREWKLDIYKFQNEFVNKCHIFNINKNDVKFYSQQDEDKYIIQYILKNKINDGTYLEIGACDGILYSNTKCLEDYFGFKGILIEPQKNYYDNLCQNRSNNECYNYAVTNGNVEYVDFIGDTHPEAGLVENVKNNTLNGDVIERFGWKTTYKVKNIKMHHILSNSKYRYIDFMIIDVEGGELDLLRSIDFTFPIFCIIIEAHSTTQERNKVVGNFLLKNGFTYMERQRGNEVWINKNYFRIHLFNDNWL